MIKQIEKYKSSQSELDAMRSIIAGEVAAWPSDLPSLLVSEHAEQNRVMPPGTPRPGPFELSYTPYLREPMDNMSPQSPIQHTVIMKGKQLGFTALAECEICYYMDHDPSDILFISATEDLIERWAARRLEPALNSYNIRKNIYAQYASKGSRKSGDKTFSKEYFGCRLDMASAQAASSLRSTDKRILIRDEIDGAPAQLRTGEGSWLDVSYARTDFWGNRRKVLDISTPTLYDDSAIYSEYLEGDQRRFSVPCPHCQHMQFIDFANIQPIMENNILIDVSLICQGCKGEIKDYHKESLLTGGVWEPTATSRDPSLRSYQISSLYAPPGAISWLEIYKKHEKAINKPDGMRSFRNLEEGLPFRESGERPKLNEALGMRGHYKKGTVPNEVLYLTAAIDVQRGSINDPDKPPRLEIEICGHGTKYRTWSIDYLVFSGSVDDPYDGAWAMLNDYALENSLQYARADGEMMSVQIVFADSGSGDHMTTVYQFSEGWQNMYPSKGFKDLQGKKTDELTRDNFIRYRAKRVSETISLIEIATNYYRNHLYKSIKRTLSILSESDPESMSGFCGFPADYKDEYFKQLTAPERKKDGSFDKRGRPAESHDCRVYNLCAADVWLDKYVKTRQEALRNAGALPQNLKKFDKKIALFELARSYNMLEPIQEKHYMETLKGMGKR